MGWGKNEKKNSSYLLEILRGLKKISGKNKNKKVNNSHFDFATVEKSCGFV